MPAESSAYGDCSRLDLLRAAKVGEAEVFVLALDDAQASVRTAQLVRQHFPLTPKEIISELDLRRPIYKATAAYGHFGRTGDGFTWERTDKAEALRAAAGV